MPIRSTRDALSNDRLRLAIGVLDDMAASRARQEELALRQGQLEAQARITNLNAAVLEREAKAADYKMWRETRSAADTANVMGTIQGIDLDDSDAVNEIKTSLAANIYAGEQEKAAALRHLAAAEARQEEFRTTEQTLGVRAQDFMIPVQGAARPDGSPVLRLDRKAYGQAQSAAARDVSAYRTALAGKSFQDVERFDTLVNDRGISPQAARQAMDRHFEATGILAKAAELGVDSNLIEEARKRGTVNVRTTKASSTFSSAPGDNGDPLNSGTQVTMLDNLDDILGTRVGGGPTLRDVMAERTRARATATEARTVAEGRMKSVQALQDAVKLIPENQRANIAKAIAEFTGASATELLQAGQAERDPGSPAVSALPDNTQRANEAAKKVIDALKPPAPANAAADSFAQQSVK